MLPSLKITLMLVPHAVNTSLKMGYTLSGVYVHMYEGVNECSPLSPQLLVK